MSVPVTKSVAILKPKGEDRVRGGHPWVYRSDIADVIDAEPGAIVKCAARATACSATRCSAISRRSPSA